MPDVSGPLLEIALRFWEQLDSPVSLACAIQARYGDWQGVLNRKVVPSSYVDPQHYSRDNAALCFLKKNPYVPAFSAKQRRESCVQAWQRSEFQCFETNQRLAFFEVSPLSEGAPAEFLRRVRKQLIVWLGYGPSDEELHSSARHGPGTTFSSSVRSPTAADKYQEIPTLTHSATWFLASVVGTKWGEQIASRYVSSYRDCIQFTRGNRFTTVPKTSVTDRGIAIEGSLNVYFQLAVGTALRNRLKRSCGWDLDVAQDIHRKMACLGSIDGSFSTLDLSNASDTVSKSLVRILFNNTRWLSVFEDLRSSHTFVDGRWHLLEKFSSMGNGFTFELETLIFAAVCCEVAKLCGYEGQLGRDVFVFGDDLIVPGGSSNLLIRTLSWLGFSINEAKSFVDGPFRESCGEDFFDGVNVRGFYWKGRPDHDSQAIYTLHNGAKALFERLGINSPWFLNWVLINHLSPRLRIYGGPSRLGDSVLHGVSEKFRWKNGIRWAQAIRWSQPLVIPWSHFSEAVRLACSLTGYGSYAGISQRGLRPDGSVQWVSVS